MEFLVTNLPAGSDRKILDDLQQLRIGDEWDGLARDYGGVRLFLNGTLLSGQQTDFAFDGSVIFDDRIVTLFRNYEARSLRALQEAARTRPNDVVGCFCLLTVSKSLGRFLLQFDALNAYPSFLLRMGDRYAVSNNVHFIEAVASAAGIRLTRTVLPYLSEFALGSAYDVGSPYKEVAIVGPGQTVRGAAGKLSVSETPPSASSATVDASYNDGIGHAAERLRRRIEIVAEAFEPRNVYFDLTGGMDSRIVLAAVVSRNPRLPWDFRALFDPPHPDGHCAALFAETFGLGRVKGIPPDDRRRMSPFEQMRAETFGSMGVGAKQGWTVTPSYRDIAHIHGGYGEIAGSSPDGKRFLNHEGPLTYESLLDTYFTKLKTLGVLNFFTTEGVEWLRGVMLSRLGSYRVAGVAARDAPLHYYNRGRLRSHFGVISRLRSQNRNYIDLLYDMQLEGCALKLEPKMRVAGKVNFDLIRLVGGDEVVGLPMANARWDPALFADGTAPAALRAHPITAGTPKTFQNVPQARIFDRLGDGREVSFSSRPDETLPRYDISQVPPAYRDIFRRQLFLATYLPRTRNGEELEPLLDWERVDTVLGTPPDQLIRYPYDLFLHALCDITIWHQKMELSVFR